MNDQASDTFLYIFRSGPDAQSMAQMSPEELQKMMDAWFSWLGDLRSKGIYEAGDPLEEQGKVVRGKDRPTVTDGPYAEGKEEVGGYVIVKARDLEHATELSKGCPILQNGGTVEVRPIQKMPMP